MIYVDASIWPLGRMKMCHMIADDLDELHDMASTLGIRRWFQHKPGKTPHYDICMAKRARVLRLGGKEVDRKQVVAIMEMWKQKQAESLALAPTTGKNEEQL